jgi:hypothetical protein
MIGGLAKGSFESLILVAFGLETLEVVCRDKGEHKCSWAVIQGSRGGSDMGRREVDRKEVQRYERERERETERETETETETDRGRRRRKRKRRKRRRRRRREGGREGRRMGA